MSRLAALIDSHNERKLKSRRIESLYPAALLICRLVLSLTQLSVSTETWKIFTSLSRLRDGHKRDLSITKFEDWNTDCSWVPTILREESMPENYGKNKLFNWFIIRFLHYLHSQVGSFILYPSVATFLFMTILNVYEIFAFFQNRWQKSKVRRINLWLKSCLYVLSAWTVAIQSVILLFESSLICHMEMIYPFLFVEGNRFDDKGGMLLKNGACTMNGRLLACILFNLGALVPDTYLLLISTLQPLRLYSIFNFAKISGGMLGTAAFIMACIVRIYLSAALDPKRLADKATINFMKNNPLINVKDYYPRTGWTIYDNAPSSSCLDEKWDHLPVYDFQYYLDSRVKRTLSRIRKKSESGGAASGLSDDQYPKSLKKTLDATSTAQKNIVIYDFSRDSYDQVLYMLDLFICLSFAIGLISIFAGLSGFVLVLTRHRFLAFVNFLVSVYVFLTGVCHLLIVSYPLNAANFFCNIREYIPSLTGASFESMAIFTWTCRSKVLYELALHIISTQMVLCLVDVPLLYNLIK